MLFAVVTLEKIFSNLIPNLLVNSSLIKETELPVSKTAEEIKLLNLILLFKIPVSLEINRLVSKYS